jgi:hypothetical protein
MVELSTQAPGNGSPVSRSSFHFWVHATKVDATWTLIANADELKRLKNLADYKEVSKKLHSS